MRIVKIETPLEGMVYETKKGNLCILENPWDFQYTSSVYKKTGEYVGPLATFNGMELVEYGGTFDENGFTPNVSEEASWDIHDEVNLEKLHGRIGITHTIKDNKLIEIPRRDIEVGDVFVGAGYGDDTTCIVVSLQEDVKADRIVLMFEDGDFGAYSSNDNFLHKCLRDKQGIMGVTHEIDWSRKE